MAQLNFPDPAVTQTYTEAGITWTWNATLGVWSSDDNDGFTETDADQRYLRIDAGAPDQTRVSGEATFAELTTHAAGVSVTGGNPNLGVNIDLSSNNSGHGLKITPGLNGHALQAHNSNTAGLTNTVDLQSAYAYATGQQMLRLKSTVTNLAITSKAIGIYNEDTEVVSIDFDGQASFAGLTEHAGGVSVTGGDLAVQDGRISVVPNNSDGSNRAWLYSVEGTMPNTITDGRLFFSRPTYAGTGTLPSIVHFQAQPQTRPPAGLTITTQIGFSASSNLEGATVTNAYGFYSSLSATGVNSYNFYAAGSAPNYFSGTVIVSKDTNSTSEILGGTKTGMYFNASTGGIAINKDDNNGNLNLMQCMRGGTATTRRFLDFRFSGTTNKLIGWIDATESAVAYRTTSDYRLKENIAPITSASDRVKQLNPCSFNFIGVDETVEGFIAHEIQAVVPATASGTKDETEVIGTFTDVDGNIETEVTEPEAIPYGATWEQTGTRDVYQGVDQTKLIPLLTKALQEALERIEALEAQLNP